ncbi:MAG: SH3 domain-containing protein [Anaerolineae bacterium]|nr:SH3 domain-containing protein [Anaerolineae bacterium]MDW8171747.1 SH3 domain-containing protein [Anaerolineae bacterium]
MFKRLLALSLLALFVLSALPTLAQAAVPGRVLDTVNVRAEPGRQGQVLGRIAVNSSVTVEWRNQRGNWVIVTDGNLRGWVASRYVQWSADVPLANLPVSNESIGASSVVAEGNPSAAPLSASDSHSVGRGVRAIYANGLARGNNPRVFIKVGDSITAAQHFLKAFESGQYQLGPGMESLAQTIEYFRGSFGRDSIAAQSGFTIGALQDPMWAPSDVCQPNEWPLVCELRLSKPAFAIIMIGSLDVRFFSADAYEYLLRTSLEAIIKNGTVPILTTFPNADWYFGPESARFNDIIRRVARSYQVPLVDLRSAAASLPNGGVKEDGFHLTEPSEGELRSNFNGGQTFYGLTLRELMTLQTLDALRRQLAR